MAEPLDKTQNDSSGIRLAELMAVLSIATDLGMGQPMEYAMSTAVLAVRFGETIGLTERELREVYYLALLRHIGCNAETYRMAAVVGDELALRTDIAAVDVGQTAQIINLLARHIRQANQGVSPLQLARTLAQEITTFPALMKIEFAGFCEVAQRLAERLGFGKDITHALGQAYERWDGKGMPANLKGEEIVLSVRLVTLVQDLITFQRLEGPEAALAMAKERKGTAYDPWLVEQFCRKAAGLLAELPAEPDWDTVLAIEPGKRAFLGGEQFDNACQAIADFADLKSPYTLGHSSGVAELAARAARQCGLPHHDIVSLRRAGWLHDLGQVGISAGVWGKPGPLSQREWEQVRLHTYYTERVLSRSEVLAQLGQLAAHHHERLDGSGYHRAAPAANLSSAARLLAAADTYQAITETRPHRPARSPEEAAEELRREVRLGHLDSEAVNGVLAAAGHRVSSARRELVSGLSEREIEVLRLVARGNSMKEIAQQLSISKKTADNHIQHIYTKIGVSTRAGAALFAMEHHLLTNQP